MTDESITRIKPERLRKIGLKKCMYFHLFKIEPFRNVFPFIFSPLPSFFLWQYLLLGLKRHASFLPQI